MEFKLVSNQSLGYKIILKLLGVILYQIDPIGQFRLTILLPKLKNKNKKTSLTEGWPATRHLWGVANPLCGRPMLNFIDLIVYIGEYIIMSFKNFKNNFTYPPELSFFLLYPPKVENLSIYCNKLTFFFSNFHHSLGFSVKF